MTAITAPAEAATLSSRLMSPLRAVGRFLVFLAEANPRARALQALAQTSDEALAAKGKTRHGEIQRILGGASIY